MIGIDDLQAHWRRDWIKAPGFEDHATHVHWMQCGAYYADLRVPDDLPSLSGARRLSDLDPETLRALIRAEGFAGTITVEDDVCTWNRRINWHGAPRDVDAGRISFCETGALIEDGVHAEYRELWQRQPHSPIEALGGEMDGQDVFMMSSEATFLLGVGWPDAPPSDEMIEALERGERPDALAAHFSSAYVMGLWDGADGIALRATDPFLAGDVVVSRSGQQLQYFAKGYDGAVTRKTVSLTALT